MSPLWSALAFMDSGRVADEFEPSLRRQLRTAVLSMLVTGTILMIIGLVLAILPPMFEWLPVLPILVAIPGAVVLGVGVYMWVKRP